MTSLAKVPYQTSTVITTGQRFVFVRKKIEKKAKRPKNIVILKAENIEVAALRKVGIHRLAHITNQALMFTVVLRINLWYFQS